MIKFTSPRERLLWIWTIVVIVAIYSTLGMAGVLADVLRKYDQLDNVFFLSFLLLIAAIAGNSLKRKPGKLEIWIFLGIIAVYVMAFIRLGISPVERTHLIEYGLVAVLIHEALLERRHNGKKVPYPAIIAIVSAMLLGWIDEGLQAILPNRVYDIIDVGFNSLAALMGVSASMVLRWARQRVANDSLTESMDQHSKSQEK